MGKERVGEGRRGEGRRRGGGGGGGGWEKGEGEGTKEAHISKTSIAKYPGVC